MAGWSLNDARGNSIAVTALMEALRGDANDKVRSIAAWSLGSIGDEDAVPALVAALKDANKGVRTRAVWALGAIEPRQAPPALLAVLRDSEPMVRQLAAWALFQIEDPGAIPALNAALKAETDSNLRVAYIKALAATGEKSVDALRDLLLSTDPKIKQIAVRALAGGGATGPWPWPWPEPRPFP
jgi:HEAT repeat protein